MNYDFPLWKASRSYVCPSDAGPAWREAFESGIDMAELEDNLKLSPWERLQKHDQKMNDFVKREEFSAFLRQGREFAGRIEARK